MPKGLSHVPTVNRERFGGYSERVQIRWTEPELAQVQEAAYASGAGGLSAFIRAAALREAQRVLGHPAPTLVELAQGATPAPVAAPPVVVDDRRTGPDTALVDLTRIVGATPDLPFGDGLAPLDIDDSWT